MTKVLNDLFDYENIKIYQDDELFKFSLDSILLAEFINLKLTSKKMLDLCTGNAPIPLIVSLKSDIKIDCIELQKKVYDLACESINCNMKNNQIKIINDDCKNYEKYYLNDSYDIVSCNPPYFEYIDNLSLINKNIIKSVARHEIKIKLCDIINIASKLLKNNGSFYLSHRTERFEEIILLLNKNHFSIKRVQFIYKDEKDSSKLVLIEAIKNGKTKLKVENPVFTSKLKSYQNIFKEK